ncbi:hypothetical protein J5N97_020512 [Dioscorea zingiberensis]|uniref:Uncharacterized protein n=1 Tax=Dioscorea zingiberensis TaxID=325984 RepID=A0A9D5CG12_9LILI|nr:hypothetical protein J5N97_020512 [Dioscorea zingiberensis]
MRRERTLFRHHHGLDEDLTAHPSHLEGEEVIRYPPAVRTVPRVLFSKNSPEPDIYEEYVKRNEILRKEKEAQVANIPPVGDQKKERDEEIEKEEEKEEEEEGEEEETECNEDIDRDEDEGLLLEELNRRAEDFIARVNMQRSLEARMLL